ncbi:MAG: Uma2 family endonuclease [Stenomitos rutilans HA7619-LM2]|jgi:Uma2 family endonuclease|nr:Uma2 family endonuclease [Stenomitos rutilans HA7619-LM2]
MAKKPKLSEQRLVLEKISWQQLEALLMEMGTDRTARFTFDRGRLELMTPLEEHDRCHRLIESLILVLAEVMKLPVEGYKALTLKRPDLGIAVEPDTGYYIQHEQQIHGKVAIDLALDPPPDLVLDVSLSQSTLDRLSLYARLDVPEVWRYVSQPGDDFLKGQLHIYRLDQQHYSHVTHGLAFPFLPAGRILQFIDESDALGLMTALRSLRAWLQEISI